MIASYLKNKKSKLLVLPLLFCFTVYLTSCTDEDQAAGFGMLHDDDILTTYVDSTSTTIAFTTFADDSIRSTSVTYMVGEIEDDIFGKTRAGFFTRLYLQGMRGNISSYTLDSASFNLAKSSKYVYGETSVPQTLSLYELTQDITVNECSAYYQSGTKPTCINSASHIMDIQVPAYNSETVFLQTTLDANYSQALFEKVKNCYNVDTTVQYFDSLFIKSFKGIYVTTKDDTFNGAKSVITHCVPGLTFYLHSAKDTITLSFAPSPQSFSEPLPSDPSQIYMQAINVFEHEYPTSITSSLGSESTTAYVQGLLGLKTKLTLSGLEYWRDSTILNSENPVIFNSAKLRVPVKQYSYDYLPLNFRVYDSSNELVFTTMSLTADSSICEFNIQNFLLYLFNHPEPADDYSYEISVPENNLYANGFVLDGTITDKLKLVITYTK